MHVIDLTVLISILDVTLPRLKAFISQLLSRLHIEALLHGNITKQVGAILSLITQFLFKSSIKNERPV